MFVDRAKIQVRSGNGGRGCVAFRREKFVPRGGPSGGDGGNGGSVTLRADPGASTLNRFHYRQHFFAGNGLPGEGNQRSGRHGEDVILSRPSRFGLGFQLAQPSRPIGPNASAFGHYGFGGSLGFGDPDANVAFGYLINHPGQRWQSDRNQRLIDALYASL
jgi:CubicO group peptidase (beta-lactamase class C family)